MGLIEGAISLFGAEDKIFKPKEKPKPNTIMELVNYPERFKLTAWVENDTVFINIGKKEQGNESI